MSKRNPGGLLSTTGLRKPSTSDQSQTSGVWTLDEQYQAESKNTWVNPSAQIFSIDKSLRFRSGGSTFLSRTPTVTGNRRVWTWSGWVKRVTLSGSSYLMTCQSQSGNDGIAAIYFNGEELHTYYDTNGANPYGAVGPRVYRDVGAWYHVIWAVDSSLGVHYVHVNGELVSTNTAYYPPATGYEYAMNRSGHLHTMGAEGWDGSPTKANMYLAEVNFIDGQILTPDYFGYFDYNNNWQPKKYNGDFGTNGFYLPFKDSSTTYGLGKNYAATRGTNLTTYSEQLDHIAWTKYQTTVTANATTAPDGATTADKVIANTSNDYHTIQMGATVVSGQRVTMSVYAKAAEYGVFLLNENINCNAQAVFAVGPAGGTASTASSNNQGTFNAVSKIENVGNGWYRCSVTWTAVAMTSIAPTIYISNSLTAYNPLFAGNGSSGMFFWGMSVNYGGADQPYIQTLASAINNDWTANNFSVTGSTNDSMVDSPTNGSIIEDTGLGGQVPGNYCTLNPLYTGFNLQWTNGNLSVNNTTTESVHRICSSTMGMTSGKWYWEVAVNNSANVDIVGVISEDFIPDSYVGGSGASAGWGYNTSTGSYYPGSSWSSSGTAPAFPSSGNIAVAFDADAKKMWFGTISGGSVTWNTAAGGVGNPAAGTNATFTYTGTETTFFPAVSIYFNTGTWTFNFGQRPFLATAPSGFKTLNSANLPMPIIGNQNFNAVLYAGNSSTQTVTVGFKPDFIWYKCRNNTRSHRLTDSSRGFFRDIYSDASSQEATDGSITAFTSNGFSISNSNGSQYNTTGETYVSWNWKASNTTPVTNTVGTYTSTVNANVAAGFSIVQWTGNGSTSSQTVGHGLSKLPTFVIIKKRNKTENWYAAHYRSGYTLNYAYHNFLNTTASIGGSNDPYYMGTQIGINDSRLALSPGTGNDGATENGINYIAYCWHDVPGFSKMGGWRNNGDPSGTFVFTGFRPAFILLKNSDNVESWYIVDNARRKFNVATGTDTAWLSPNQTTGEPSGYITSATIDFLSNGFKIRTGNTGAGEVSFGTRNYFYAAFAEHPFNIARAR